MAGTTDNRPRVGHRSALGIAPHNRENGTRTGRRHGAHRRLFIANAGLSQVGHLIALSENTHRRLRHRNVRQPHHSRVREIVSSRYAQPALHMPDPLSMTCPTPRMTPSISPSTRCAADGTYEGSYFIFHRRGLNLSSEVSETALSFAPPDYIPRRRRHRSSAHAGTATAHGRSSCSCACHEGDAPKARRS